MHRYVTATCVLVLVILGVLSLTFSSAHSAMQMSSITNVALSSTASASSSFSGNFPVASVNNGDRKAQNWGSGGGWNDNTQGEYSSDVVQINFPRMFFSIQLILPRR